MEEEAANQNTPDGWTAVQLPKNLPAITESNMFYITSYGASEASADNTTAIQAALDAVPSTGGMVVVPAGTWMFGRIEIKSKTILHLCAGATLKLLAYADQSDHTTKIPYIRNKKDACDIVIEGESKTTSIIEGQGGPWWDAVEQKEENLQRGSIIRFDNGSGSRFLFRNFRIQNAPGTNLTLGSSGRGTHNTVHDVSIYAPSSHASDPSHNTDGIPVWAPYANIYNCDIDTGDDNVVTDSYAQYIHVWNCLFKAGHGASLGSYTSNMHDIIYESLTFEGTDCGFRLKSNIGRSGDVYNLVFRNCTMTGVTNPIQITAWYDTLPNSPAAAAESPEKVTSTTPKFHDILIQNVTATGYNTALNNAKNGYGIFIYGRPESLVKDVTFDKVTIEHGKGMKLNFCEGIKFINNCSYKNTTSNVSSSETSVSGLIDEQYNCSYTWNGYEQEVILSQDTYSSSDVVKEGETVTSATYIFNNGYTIHNTDKEYANGYGSTKTIKYSTNRVYTINIPAGKSIRSITFTGYGNNANGNSYIAELNGSSFSEDAYVFEYKNKPTTNDLQTKTITLDTPATNTLKFKVGGQQAAFIIKLLPAPATGITTPAIPDSDSAVSISSAIYDLQGRKVADSQEHIPDGRLPKGIYIWRGKKFVVK